MKAKKLTGSCRVKYFPNNALILIQARFIEKADFSLQVGLE